MVAPCILVTNQLLLRIPRRMTATCLIFLGSESDLRENGIYKPTANHGFFSKSAAVVESRAIYHFRSRFPRIEVRSAGKQYQRFREIPRKWPFPGNKGLRRIEARVARKWYLPQEGRPLIFVTNQLSLRGPWRTSPICEIAISTFFCRPLIC